MTENLRVVFYARVSTDQVEQLHSLEQQKDYFEKYIKQNPNWTFIDGYIDEGITGTSALKRPRFMKMISDAKERKFDLILTKEVSRFARNTVDTLMYTRELKKYGTNVIFTIDGINTADKDGELKLTIMASLAQEEARKTSERVRWGHTKNMENGVVYGSNNILGYNVHDGKLTINREQSETVKLIYKLYLEGLGVRAIKMELESRQIPTSTGKQIWQHPTIMRILKNEKYVGDLIQKKYITVDYLDKRRKKNQGEEQNIIIRNHHEPIVDRVTFNKVQLEISRREKITHINNQNTSGRYSAKYPYSGKIICAECGAIYKRKVWNKKVDGTYTYAWMCGNRDRNGKKGSKGREDLGCNSVAITEKDLDNIMKLTIKELFLDKDKVINTLKIALNKSIKNKNSLLEIKEIKNNISKYKKRLDNLIDMRLEGEINKDTFREKKVVIDEQISHQNELLKKYDVETKNIYDKQERINKLIEIFSERIDFNKNIPDRVTRDLLNHLIVKNKNEFDIYLNTGECHYVKI